MAAAVAALGRRFDALGIGARAPGPPSADEVVAYEEATRALNEALESAERLGVYLAAAVSVDSRDATAQSRYGEVRQRNVALEVLLGRYTAWVGALDLDVLLSRSALAREHAFPLAQLQVDAAHQMGLAEEALAAELRPSGSSAWTRLHSDVSSQIAVTLDPGDGGGARALPMSELRNLALSPHREVRRRAWEAELAAWQVHALPLAAAMSGVKGAAITLAARRGWDSPLDEALHAARIDRPTLEAMNAACEAALPDFRRYLRAKARALGLPVLAWYDLTAPLPEGGGEWTWDGASRLVLERFGSYSPRLRGLAERALAGRWIDAEPRPGKEGGGFCLRLREDESRVLINFEPSWSGVSVLAHELGHAYHNLCTAGRPPLRRRTPMTLAETASILCETIVRGGALETAGAGEGAVILEASLQAACAIVVDIRSRFRLEDAIFAARRTRALSADELCALTLEAQREAYGEGLDPEALHPWMWAVKPHYYGRAYYNFPYTFGLLFGLGLYARYEADPEDFRAGYDELLASTGEADAATLAGRFGLDLRSPGFWTASLDVIRADIDRFEALAP